MKKTRYKNSGTSKNEWIADKVSKLITEGNSLGQSQAIANAMYNSGDNNFKAGGNYNKLNYLSIGGTPPDYNSLYMNMSNEEENLTPFTQNQKPIYQPLQQEIDDAESLRGYTPNFENQIRMDSQITEGNVPQTFDADRNLKRQMRSYENDLYNKSQNSNGKTRFINPYGGFDIPSAAFTLGQGIQSGSGFDIATGGLKLLTGLGRNVASGMGYQNRREWVLDEYGNKVREGSRPSADYQQNGGYFQDGGQIGQQAPQQQQDPTQMIAEALQAGADPQEILKQLSNDWYETYNSLNSENQKISFLQSIGINL